MILQIFYISSTDIIIFRKRRIIKKRNGNNQDDFSSSSEEIQNNIVPDASNLQGIEDVDLENNAINPFALYGNAANQGNNNDSSLFLSPYLQNEAEKDELTLEKIKKMFEELNDSKKVMILQEDDHDKKKLEDLYPPIMNEKKINSILGVPNQEDSEIKNPYDSQYPGQLATFECYTV